MDSRLVTRLEWVKLAKARRKDCQTGLFEGSDIIVPSGSEGSLGVGILLLSQSNIGKLVYGII